VLDRTGKAPIRYATDPALVSNVEALESRNPELGFEPATCRFLQSRPRMEETYIH
jgi:hypothetical protein